MRFSPNSPSAGPDAAPASEPGASAHHAPDASAQEVSGAAMLLADLGGRIRHVNPQMRDLLASHDPAGDAQQESVAAAIAALASVEPAVAAQVVADVSSGKADHCDVPGARRPLSLSLLREADGTPFVVRVECQPGGCVTEDAPRRRSPEAGTPMPSQDPLTGLLTRAAFLERVTQVLESSQPEALTAVMFLDLDNFKEVNEGYGSDVADEVLIETGRRLSAAIRPPDTVARLGADEFVVMCASLSSETRATAIADRLLDVVAKPIGAGGGDIVVTSSIGIAIASGDAPSAEAVLNEADSAMYRAKARGKNQIEVFDDILRRISNDRMATEGLLQEALRERLFRLHYQPIYELATGELVGVESLIRMEHPKLGMLSPAHFIDVAESSGLIVPIGAWVLEESCRQLAEWHAAGAVPNTVRVAVNLSARQVSRSDLLKTVSHALGAAGLEPTSLSLELTESIFMDADSAHVRQLEQLREMGVVIEIDDFGTGYSSLGYLKRLPVGVVKVDQSFVAGMLTSSADYGIVNSVVGLGQALGLVTIAEGVETAEQLDALWVLGCDQVQGYHLGRPCPPSRPPLPITDWGEQPADEAQERAS